MGEKKLMNVLHMIPYTIFISNYISAFMQKKMGEENFFYVYGSHVGQEDRNIKVDDVTDVLMAENIVADEFEVIYARSDILIMQYIPETLTMCEMVYNCMKKYQIPLVIVPWGRELFNKSELYSRTDSVIINKIDIYKKFFIENCAYIVTSNYAFEFIKENYDVHCKSSYFNWLNQFSINDCNTENFGRGQNAELGIMIGHRGTTTSGHIAVFEKVQSLFEEKVRVICPLVYGNQYYIQNVIKKGKELFGDGMICLTSWQEKQAYYQFLYENVDVAIFNNDSSEGQNTILYLIYAGKKVFINRNNEVYWILKELGVVYGEYSQELSKEEIATELSFEDKKKNKDILENFGSIEEFRKNWTGIYKEVLK